MTDRRHKKIEAAIRNFVLANPNVTIFQIGAAMLECKFSLREMRAVFDRMIAAGEIEAVDFIAVYQIAAGERGSDKSGRAVQ